MSLDERTSTNNNKQCSAATSSRSEGFEQYMVTKGEILVHMKTQLCCSWMGIHIQDLFGAHVLLSFDLCHRICGWIPVLLKLRI